MEDSNFVNTNSESNSETASDQQPEQPMQTVQPEQPMQAVQPVQPVQPTFSQQQYLTSMNGASNPYYMNTIMSSLAGWSKFIGILTIIGGAFTCIGLITAVVGVPLIFAGLGLVKASDKIKTYMQNRDLYELNDSLINFEKYFKITGIMQIVQIVFLVLYIIFIIVMVVFMIAAIPGFTNEFSEEFNWD